ncbi:hypothetical protein C2W58_00606 [Bacillus pumilus]|uniref:Uncharacterized protein n=1 Tax=Bacillus pumilus TaxID=1408 RepID=A0AB34R0X6_BACPU|nr:hypothetical protein B4127_4070 [Bacillus pumilus]RAP09317.1 hypothetical protein C2W58_00606 [Bacillus pumilus]
MTGKVSIKKEKNHHFFEHCLPIQRLLEKKAVIIFIFAT